MLSQSAAQMLHTPASIAALMPLGLSMAMRVVVTGAAGRTGSIVLSKLLKDASIEPIGIVRTDSSTKKLTKLGARPEQLVNCDVCDLSKLKEVLKGVDKVLHS